MDTQYTAIVKQQGDWWIGWIEEVPGINCQERSREELMKSLRVTLHEAISIREGHRHSWWGNTSLNKRSSVPRHTEIDNSLARKICKDLGIEPVK